MTNSNPRKFEEKHTNFVSWYWQKIILNIYIYIYISSYAFWKQTYLLYTVSFSIIKLEDAK